MRVWIDDGKGMLEVTAYPGKVEWMADHFSHHTLLRFELRIPDSTIIDALQRGRGVADVDATPSPYSKKCQYCGSKVKPIKQNKCPRCGGEL